jgi:putative transposase
VAEAADSPARRARWVPDRGSRGEGEEARVIPYVLDRASRGWRGLTMTTDGLRLLQDLRRSLLDPPCQFPPPSPA